MPDIVIWMISGSSRVAYYHIPANHVLFAKNPDARGKYCAKIQNILLKVSLKTIHSILSGGGGGGNSFHKLSDGDSPLSF